MKKLIGLLLLFNNIFSHQYDYLVIKDTIDTNSVTITITPDNNEYIYKDYLEIILLNNNFEIVSQSISDTHSTIFDSNFAENKDVFKDKIEIKVKLKNLQQDLNPAKLVINFVNNQNQNQQIVLTIPFAQQPNIHKDPVNLKHATKNISPNKHATLDLVQKQVHKISSKLKESSESLFSYFKNTQSLIIKLIISVVLGLLLSLTPCIYPMIPLTMSLLSSNKNKNSFLMALSYTLGISTTFAMLGFIVSLGAANFGQWQSSPFLIIPLSIFLFYMGFAMIGLYEMHIPRLLSGSNLKLDQGSYLSSYLFGAISGTIASPCLSPGLALILGYAAQSLEQGFYGYFNSFIMLFLFGIGASLPLLLVGTFSNSSKILPKAGPWMVEIKKILGFVLIFYALNYLSRLNIAVPILIAKTLFFLIISITYFQSLQKNEKSFIRNFKIFAGIVTSLAAALFLVSTIKKIYENKNINQSSLNWIYDYKSALEIAKESNRKLFVNIGSSICPACVNLEKNILEQPKISNALENYVKVKIRSDKEIDDFAHLNNKFEKEISSFGFPTILIIDPKQESLIEAFSKKMITDIGIDNFENKLHLKPEENT